jgi:hypothetical protein
VVQVIGLADITAKQASITLQIDAEGDKAGGGVALAYAYLSQVDLPSSFRKYGSGRMLSRCATGTMDDGGLILLVEHYAGAQGRASS